MLNGDPLNVLEYEMLELNWAFILWLKFDCTKFLFWLYEFVWKFTEDENLLDLPFELGVCVQENEKSFDSKGLSISPVFDLL